MSLLIDDDLVTLPDLMAIDPEVVEVADAENIILAGEGGIIQQSWNECADLLLEAMPSFNGSSYGWPGALSLTGSLGASRSRIRLSQIVATALYGHRSTPLKRWMSYQALVLFYQAASNRTVNDRYQTKHTRMVAQSKIHWRSLWQQGLPIVWNPLPCPGALYDFQAGEWSNDNLSFAPAGWENAEPNDQTYSVVITWVDEANYIDPLSKGNAESGPSQLLSVTIPAGQTLVVDISSLNPPGSVAVNRGLADGYNGQRIATGWNVYMGAPDEWLYLQTLLPNPVDVKTFALPGPPLLSGLVLQPGQVPDKNETFQRFFARG